MLVGSPLHALEIDSFSVHLVEGRQVAQARDLAYDQVGDVVDFLFRVEASEAEADARVRELVADAQGPEHVARLQARRGARRARAHRDVLDGHHQTLALYEVEADVEVARE